MRGRKRGDEVGRQQYQEMEKVKKMAFVKNNNVVAVVDDAVAAADDYNDDDDVDVVVVEIKRAAVKQHKLAPLLTTVWCLMVSAH